MTTPDKRWLLLIYGTPLVPFVGPAILILVTSALWYAWHHEQPERAQLVSRHAWVAIGLNALANVGWAIAARQ